MTAGDLDKVMSCGLGVRYAFMGPFETAYLNAEGELNKRHWKKQTGHVGKPYIKILSFYKCKQSIKHFALNFIKMSPHVMLAA